jgi:hypothetical protein
MILLQYKISFILVNMEYVVIYFNHNRDTLFYFAEDP